MARSYAWSDISMQPRPTAKLTGIDAVHGSITNLLSISRGEFLFNHELGVDLESFLFEIIDFATSAEIKGQLYSSISPWDSRVSVLPDTSVIPFPDQNRVDLYLHLFILGIAEGEKFISKFSLKRKNS